MKLRAVLSIGFVYIAAGIIAVATATRYSGYHPIVTVAIADVAATLFVFVCSMLFNNSSMYDPYWSVAPVLITFYYSRRLTAQPSILQLVMMVLVVLWSIRLTLNFLSRWDGLKHEDWRYVNLRNRTGNLYWLVSFLGIHFLPTAVVFAGCVPAYFAFSQGPVGLSVFSAAGAIVTAGAICLEGVSDLQMDSFRKNRSNDSDVFEGGLWGVVRHPNYLGEILFWWGIWIFSAAAHQAIQTIFAPVIVTGLFVAISIPMIERRLSERRESYDEYRKRVHSLLPIPKNRFGLGRQGSG